MSKSDNQPKDIKDLSTITVSFRCNHSDTNSIILSIVRCMSEHTEEIDATHSILFSYLENLRDNLITRIKPSAKGGLDMGVEVDCYILKRIESVINNPLTLEENKEDLVQLMVACIYAIRSDNNCKLEKEKAKYNKMKADFDAEDDKEKAEIDKMEAEYEKEKALLARQELIAKEILLALCT